MIIVNAFGLPVLVWFQAHSDLLMAYGQIKLLLFFKFSISVCCFIQLSLSAAIFGVCLTFSCLLHYAGFLLGLILQSGA